MTLKSENQHVMYLSGKKKSTGDPKIMFGRYFSLSHRGCGWGGGRASQDLSVKLNQRHIPRTVIAREDNLPEVTLTP